MGDYSTIDAIKREINALIEKKVSGTYFINHDGRGGWIRLREGSIEQLAFENRFNEAAVPLLEELKGGFGRFVPGPVFPGRSPPPVDVVRRWLSSALAIAPSATTSAASPTESAHAGTAAEATEFKDRPTTAMEATESKDQTAWRSAVERIALTYFGPIGPLLCEEAWATNADGESALAQIASNLLDAGEARRFLAEARAALARS